MFPHSLSVVIPTQGGRTSVTETVRALLRDTEPSLEIIVVSDGDVARTTALLSGITDTRLRIIGIPKGGSALARNTGLAACRMEWVAFVDDDDLPLDNWTDVWRDNIDVDTLAITAAVRYVRDGTPSGSRVCRLDPTDLTMAASQILAGAFWLRRELVDGAGGYDPSLRAAQNQDLGLRICDHIVREAITGRLVGSKDIVIDLRVQESRSRHERYGDARAEAAALFLERHRERLALDSKHKASLLRIIARSQRINGRIQEARRTAIAAVRTRPGDIRNLRALILALLGQGQPRTSSDSTRQ